MMMEDDDHGDYISQLRAEFDSCDSSASGFLDRDELTALCQKLHLESHLQQLLDTLLRRGACGRVNFEEFKDGFVAVLSRSLDLSTSEDDSSYLEPVIPEEVKPKFVKGKKRYGRRSRPDKPESALSQGSEDFGPPGVESSDLSPSGIRRAKLRRSTSLESIESLKSDVEPANQEKSDGPRLEEDAELRGNGGGVKMVNDDLDLEPVNAKELLQKLDSDLDTSISKRDFHIMRDSHPLSSSTPSRSLDQKRGPHRSQEVLEECSGRSTTPSLLMATVGQRVLSRLDDGTGCCSPEQVVTLWTEEGIRSSREILQTLDFSLDDRLSLVDLTLALDNELLVSGNGIHQAALISYKNEIQHLQVLAEQASRERDKVKADLDHADQRNLQLVSEVDDRHASMENLNQSRIRDLEQEFRDRLTAVRSQVEQESDILLLQVERERGALQEELRLLRAQEAALQEELHATAQENVGLEQELQVVKLQLTDAQNSVSRLQNDLDQLLNDKFGNLDSAGCGLSLDERFADLIKEYEQQCRELRDRNDELSSELELLTSQRSNRKSRRASGGDAAAVLNWTQPALSASIESDSDLSDVKRTSSPQIKKKLQPDDKEAVCPLDDISGPAVSIQTEMALEQLKRKHDQELQQLRIQLETQVNYYERSLEQMRQSMELERKDICQTFKLEISELEEQKLQVEQEVKQLQEALGKLQLQHGGGGWNSEQERKMQRERAEMEQNFAREIGNLVQRLSSEKDQLEAELKLKMDQEVSLLREKAEQQRSHLELQQADSQRRLLHQLHCERQRMQEARVLWEIELTQSEQEKTRVVEQHEEANQTSNLQISQSEKSVEALRVRCGRVEEELKESRAQASELEARLLEACAQLEESIAFIEEKSLEEEELQLLKGREQDLLQQVYRLRAELENMHTNSCSLSDFVVQHTASSLEEELEALQKTIRSRASELDSLKADRDRLIQDLKDQAMAVDTLQLQLDQISEELDQMRTAHSTVEKTLEEEQARSLKLQGGLEEEKEEVGHLRQEKQTYAGLADQLSTQIVEMEEEICTLREHLREVSCQLNQTSNLVLDLRTQLNAKTSEADWLRTSSESLLREVQQLSDQLEVKSGDLGRAKKQVLHLEQVLLDSKNHLRLAEDNFEQEKQRMTRQLVEMEGLVLALEEVVDPTSPHRTRLEEVRSENGALQERLRVMQQEVQSMEDDAAKKRRKLEELERTNERSRVEEERLHEENSRYREEVLDLSNRNLQLSKDNAELSARLRGDQESVRLLQERLVTVAREQEEEGAAVRRLQDAALQQEREKLQQHVAWTQEKQLMEKELGLHREKLVHVSALEAEISSMTLKLQWSEDDKTRLLRETEEQSNKVVELHQSLLSLETDSELLRSQLQAVNQEKLSQAQEVTELRRRLHDAEDKERELHTSIRKLVREKEEHHQALVEQEDQISSLHKESHKLLDQNQQLQSQLSEMQVQSLEVQSLKTRLKELEMALTQAEEQVRS
uniref:Ninein-like n=1 Tax=Takifugu rubripes TaxID=31033 RepID=H2SR77_TAKRU